MPQAENNEVLAELSQVKHGQMQLNGLRGSEGTIRPSPLQAKKAVFLCCLLKCSQYHGNQLEMRSRSFEGELEDGCYKALGSDLILGSKSQPLTMWSTRRHL